MPAQSILLIEDNEDNAQLVRFLLESSGYRVFTASDGVTGLDKAFKIVPDLILLDLSIPEMDGWEVAQKLKQDKKTKTIPLVALTALTSIEDKRRAMEAGCQGYITKPIVDVTKFSRVIKRYLPD